MFSQRYFKLALALVLALVGGGLLYHYYGRPHATLRVTTGITGGLVSKFVDAFVAGTQKAHPWIKFKTVETPDLVASAKAMEKGEVDIAFIRPDIAAPSNGNTLVIVRRDAIAIILSQHSPIDDVAKLTGKTIVIPTGPAQDANSKAFDLILNYYNVKPESVKREFMSIPDIGQALAHNRAAAAVAVGPVGPGDVVDTVAAVARATKGTPKVLSFDDNDAISSRFPALESIDIPEGAFRAKPETPDDDIKGVAVSYRLVVPDTMLDIVAGALGRSVLNTKARLMQLTPLASQLEAPDTQNTNTILPIHPGFANFLNNGDSSFFDEIQTYIYTIGIPLSLLGSFGAIFSNHLSNKRARSRQDKITRLLIIADEANDADREALLKLEGEYRTIISACVKDLLDGSLGADKGSVSLAVEHARHALERRRLTLAQAAA